MPEQDNKTWQEAVADDFVILRKAGLEHPQMEEIEQLLGIKSRP